MPNCVENATSAASRRDLLSGEPAQNTEPAPNTPIARTMLTRSAAAVMSLEDPVDPQFVREFQASTICKPIPDAFFNGLVAESLKLPARLWREVLGGNARVTCVGVAASEGRGT